MELAYIRTTCPILNKSTEIWAWNEIVHLLYLANSPTLNSALYPYLILVQFDSTLNLVPNTSGSRHPCIHRGLNVPIHCTQEMCIDKCLVYNLITNQQRLIFQKNIKSNTNFSSQITSTTIVFGSLRSLGFSSWLVAYPFVGLYLSGN